MDSNAHFSDHLISDIFRLRRTGRDNISRNHFNPVYLYRFQTAQSQCCNNFQRLHQILVQRDLEGTFFQTIFLQKPRHQNGFFMFDFYHRIRTDPSRHFKNFFSCKRNIRYVTLLLIPLYIWVNTFVKYSPDVESKGDIVFARTWDFQISSIFYMNLFQLVKQIFHREFGEYIYNARVDAEADTSHIPFFFPLFMPIKVVFGHRLRNAFLQGSINRWVVRHRPCPHAHIISSRFISSVKNIIGNKRRGCIHHKVAVLLSNNFYQFIRIFRI